jgi:prevent-host-death family protein
MKTTAISDLKAHLSEYLDQVKAGTEVMITDRGKPVAKIVPVSGRNRPRQALSRMEKKGLMKLGTGKLPKNFWTSARGEDVSGLVLKALIEDRESGR